MAKATSLKATVTAAVKPRASRAKKVTMDKTTMSAHEKTEVKRIVPGEASETKRINTGRKSARQLDNEQRAQLAETMKAENDAANNATETNPTILVGAPEGTRASALSFDLPKEESNVDFTKLGAPNPDWKEIATDDSAKTAGFSRPDGFKSTKLNWPTAPSTSAQITQISNGLEMLNGFAFLHGALLLSETPIAVSIQQRLKVLVIAHRTLHESMEYSYPPIDLSNVTDPSFHEVTNPWFVNNGDTESFDSISALSAKLVYVCNIYERLSGWNFEGMDIDKIASKAFLYNLDHSSLSSLHMAFSVNGEEKETQLLTVISFIRIANKIKQRLSFDLGLQSFKPYFFIEPEPLSYSATQKERFTAEFESHVSSLRMMLENIKRQTAMIDSDLCQFRSALFHVQGLYKVLKAQEKEMAKTA